MTTTDIRTIALSYYRSARNWALCARRAACPDCADRYRREREDALVAARRWAGAWRLATEKRRAA